MTAWTLRTAALDDQRQLGEHSSAPNVAALLHGISSGRARGTRAGKVDAAASAERAATGRAQAMEAERDDLAAQLEEATDRAETAEARIKQLAAKANLPDFTGQRADRVGDAQVVSDLDWTVKQTLRVTESARPDTWRSTAAPD